MTKKLKKTLAGAMLAAVLLPLLGVHARAAAYAPRDPSNVVLQNIQFIGCEPFRVEASTIPALIASGSGLLYELNVGSGTVSTAYAVAFDSNVAINNGSASLPLGVSGSVSVPAGYAISPRVFTASAGAAAPTVAGAGTWVPNAGAGPRRYEKGLVVSNSDIGLITYGCYRADSGKNPGP